MKKFYFLLITILLALSGWSKTTTWTGAGTNSFWDNIDNWDNGIPVSGDVVIFPTNSSGTVYRVAQAANLNLAHLLILGNSNLRFVAATARTITITNGTGVDFLIEPDAQLSLGSNLNLTLGSGAAGNPTTASIEGLLIIEGSR